MPNYIENLLQKYNINRSVMTPCTKEIMNEESTNQKDNEECDKSEYLSLLMSIYYLANRCRGDLLFTMSTLSSRAKAPKRSDMKHLMRVF